MFCRYVFLPETTPHSLTAQQQTQQLIDNIPLILPPLLILLDDFKSTYRLRGLSILPSFLRIPQPTLKRTGIAHLVLTSIQHSISLHPTPPEPGILVPSLEELFRLLGILHPEDSGEKAKHVEQAVERGLVNGWAYAKSGEEGAEALVGVAKGVEILCREIGVGVVRWLRVSPSPPSHPKRDRLTFLPPIDIHPIPPIPMSDPPSPIHHPHPTIQPRSPAHALTDDRSDGQGRPVEGRSGGWCREVGCCVV
jgi:hypothetical protein